MRIKDAVIAVESGIIYAISPLTSGTRLQLALSGVLLAFAVMLLLDDLDKWIRWKRFARSPEFRRAMREQEKGA